MISCLPKLPLWDVCKFLAKAIPPEISLGGIFRLDRKIVRLNFSFLSWRNKGSRLFAIVA